MNEDIRFPIRPVMGTFGTMIAEESPCPICTGPHGGNLNETNLVAGAVVHLPVFVPGALLMVGGVHADQNDSEVVMGIEAVDFGALSTDAPNLKEATYVLGAAGNVRIGQVAFGYDNVTVGTGMPEASNHSGRLHGYAAAAN